MNANAEIIRPDSEEKLVMSVTLYQDDNKLFYDSALAKAVTQAEAIDLFNKGLMLVAVEDGFKRPTGITIGEEGTYTIAFGEGGSGESSDAGLIACYSAEYNDSLYLFEDEDCTIPLTSGKDWSWYARLVLSDSAGKNFIMPVGITSDGIAFGASDYFFDYNG